MTDHDADGASVVGVIGGSGQTGRAVIDAVATRGVASRVLSRNEVDGPWARCDLNDDPETIADALGGINSLYVIPPRLHPREDLLAAKVFRAAEIAGVERVVYHSVMHPSSSDVPHHSRKARAEERLRSTDLRWTILQPNTYAQNYLRRLRERNGQLELLCPWRVAAPPLAPVDLADLAEAAATALTEEGLLFGTFELAGPELLTHEAVAAACAAVWQRSVVPVDHHHSEIVGPDRLRATSDSYAYLAHYNDQGMPGSPWTLASLLRRTPTTFAEVVRRDMPNPPHIPTLLDDQDPRPERSR